MEMSSSLILARLMLNPFFGSGSLSFICLTGLSTRNQVYLYDQRNSGPLNCQDLFVLPRFFEFSLDASSAELS